MSHRLLTISIVLTLMGCSRSGDTKSLPAQSTEAKSMPPTQAPIPQRYLYSTKIPNDERTEQIAKLDTHATELSNEMRKLNAALASLEVARQFQSPQARLDSLSGDAKTKSDVDRTIKEYVHELVQTQQLIALLKVDEHGVDQIAALIRDEYSKKLGNMYEISYVNELLAGRVHQRAEMLAFEGSDHVMNGLRSRHSTEHIIKSNRELMATKVAMIVEELSREVSPSRR